MKKRYEKVFRNVIQQIQQCGVHILLKILRIFFIAIREGIENFVTRKERNWKIR